MQLSATEKIKIIMMKQGLKQPDLAKLLNVTKQNINSQFKKNNLSEKDIEKYAAALNCSYEIVFTMNSTKEKI
jgi:transcriptional regulator with XRE-family HTH domain